MRNSDRLTYREISEKDSETLVAWRSDPEVYKYFLSAHKITLEEHLNWYFNRYLQDDDRIDYIACEQTSGEPIGVFGIKKRRDGAEVSYLLKKQSQGKGYAGEAVCWLMETAKATWGIAKAIAEIHLENTPSIRLAERLGFERVAQSGNFLIYEKVL